MMMTECLSRLQAHAEEIKNDAYADVSSAASVGDVVRQGDIYLVRVADEAIDDAAGKPHPAQLAPGTSQGARHVLTGDFLLRHARPDILRYLAEVVPGCTIDMPLVGPIVRTISGCVVTHPEHGDRGLPDATVWVCVYQRAFAKEVRRVLD